MGVLALATIAENRLGSDGGGAVVVASAFAVLAAGMWARSWRLVVPALAAGALAVLILLDIDAASSTPDHLRGALDGGFRGLAHIAANRVPLSYARFGEQWYLVFPGVAAIAIGVAALRRARSRADAAVVLALLAGLAASLVVNDSPGPVTIAGLAALLAVEGGLLRRMVMLPLAHRLSASARAPVAAAPRAQE